MALRTRHWAILGITSVSIAGIVFHVPIEQLAPVLAALGGFAIWDKAKHP